MRYEGIKNLSRNMGDLLSVEHGLRGGVEIQRMMFVLQSLGLKGVFAQSKY